MGSPHHPISLEGQKLIEYTAPINGHRVEFHPYPVYEIFLFWGWKDGSDGKTLPQKPEDLRSIPQSPCGKSKLDVVVHQ